MPREVVLLACEGCRRRNYTARRNKQGTSERLAVKKYCRFERRHTLHREVR